ncbi:sigma-70 family RNA polymerase sigma factor [Flammeovirgaceae bacterium SG7u.111]|nr:sigma-70 family RNA polymerase sigma factor [Flammeovirgaceae bacterium SG7u.132]WPO36086.1 sigma-70 family RNA polymerase sigma factor [Flammeovirgaceae bacterium SG7u.111]
MSPPQEEFLEIIYQHQALIHKVCKMYRDSPEDREDLFQEITYQLWKAYPRFEGKSKVSSWMYRISLNTAMASFRKAKPTELTNLDELQHQLPAENSVEQNPQEEFLFAAIRQLEPPERAIISLYLADMNYAEMAEIMGISENYIGVRLNRIKNKLKKTLNEKSWV